MRDIRSPLDGLRSPFGPIRDSLVHSLVQRILSLLSPAAAQLLIHPVDERFLFQDRAGTIPVTADGQVVGRILDVGPLGRHLTAVSDPARGGVPSLGPVSVDRVQRSQHGLFDRCPARARSGQGAGVRGSQETERCK